MVLKKSEDNTLTKASSIILSGGILIMPCDTIYGLISLTGEPEKKIRAVKGRDTAKPFIRLTASKDDLTKYTDQKVPDKILEFWPGPLTLVVKNREGQSEAFRVPDDDYLVKLLNIIQRPVVSTSVNFTGSNSLNNICDIIDKFENLVDAVIDGGNSKEEALASTIVDLTVSPYKILRQGACVIPGELLE